MSAHEGRFRSTEEMFWGCKEHNKIVSIFKKADLEMYLKVRDHNDINKYLWPKKSWLLWNFEVLKKNHTELNYKANTLVYAAGLF